MTAKTNANKQLERDRNRAAGYKLAQLWVHPADYAALRRLVDRKNKQRGFRA